MGRLFTGSQTDFAGEKTRTTGLEGRNCDDDKRTSKQASRREGYRRSEISKASDLVAVWSCGRAGGRSSQSVFSPTSRRVASSCCTYHGARNRREEIIVPLFDLGTIPNKLFVGRSVRPLAQTLRNCAAAVPRLWETTSKSAGRLLGEAFGTSGSVLKGYKRGPGKDSEQLYEF